MITKITLTDENLLHRKPYICKLMMLKTRFTLALLLFLGLHLCFGQSLSPLFQSENKEVNSLCEKARSEMLKSEDNTKALKIADQAKQIAVNSNDALAIAKANSTFGWIFLDSNNLPVAGSFVQKAFENIKNITHPEAEGILHHQYAIIADKKGEFKNALSHYFKAYQYYINTKNFQRQGQVAGEISRIYMMNRDFSTSEKYAKIEEDLLKKHPNVKLQLSFNNKKSFVLMEKSKFREAYDLNMQSVELAKKNNLPEQIPSFYYGAAGALFEMGDVQQAEKLVDQSISLAEQQKADFTEYLVGKSQVLMAQNRNAEVEAMLKDAIERLKKNGDKFMEMQARTVLTNYYTNTKNSEAAASQMLINNRIKDSISSVKQGIALKELEYQYKDDEKQKLLESYRTSARQKNWIIALVCFLGLAALYSFINYRKNVLLKQNLFEKKEKLLESEKENALKEKELAKNQQETAVLNSKLLKEEQERLKLEKENTDRELASITLYVQEKNKMMEELQTKMDNLLTNSSEENRSKILDITRNIRQSISFEKDWDKIKLHFEKVHPEFFTKLSETYPQLTQNELKHCAYIKMNMSNKETANLLGVDHNTVKMSRYRIKKKLELPQEEDLTHFINNI